VRGLEATACACYEIDKKIYARIIRRKDGETGSVSAASRLASQIVGAIDF